MLIWREAARAPRADIGTLFMWLDKLQISKHVHPHSVAEIRRYHDPAVVAAVETRIKSYVQLRTVAPLSPHLQHLYSQAVDENTRVDVELLNELACGRVDLLITEDKGIHERARAVGLTGVMTIAEFIAGAQAEIPQLPDYRVPSIQKLLIGELDFSDPFFDSLRQTYPGFDRWLHRKADEEAYVLSTDLGIGAFLYLKFEAPDESYSDISPPLSPARRLKIGTFKVTYNGFRVGERLLHIAFDAAIGSSVDEIYVTMKDESDDQQRLRQLLEHWGFVHHGMKTSAAGQERVFVRPVFAGGQFRSIFEQYPRIRRDARCFLVPIYPEYHTELFPESILGTESPHLFVEQAPHRNGIAKSYISRSIDRSAKPGDALLFYRTADKGSGWHTSVLTTLAIVERLVTDISSFEEFAAACRRRSVFSDDELRRHWDWSVTSRPFVIHLLHVQSMRRRPNRRALIEADLIPQAPPRGLVPLSPHQFLEIIRIGQINERLVID